MKINIEKTIEATGTRAMVNYFVDESRVLVALDQPIIRYWSLRFTHSKTSDGFSDLQNTGLEEDNISQLRFRMGF